MRLNIRNALVQAAKELEDEDGCSVNGYGHVLRELADNLAELASNPAKEWPEFARIYCLNPEDLK